MTEPATLAETQPSGWLADILLGFQHRNNRTVLAERKSLGPLAVQRALYPEDEVCHVYLLHPPGGVVGGDRLNVSINVQENAHALVTTPGATKFYRSAGEYARQTQKFVLDAGATLEWLPQEAILFPGAKVKSQLELHLHPYSKVAAWDIQCLGRPSIEEKFTHGELDNHWQVWRDNKPVLIERLRREGDSPDHLSQLQGFPVSGMLLITPVNEAQLNAIKEMEKCTSLELLASTLLENILVIRYLGSSTENAHRYFSNVWRTVRKESFGKAPITPRIWNT